LLLGVVLVPTLLVFPSSAKGASESLPPTLPTSLYVEKSGKDGDSCGTIAAPCLSISGGGGANAKIVAANDNGFATCSDDALRGCGQCVGADGRGRGVPCNQDRDCGSEDTCTAKTCGGGSAAGLACGKDEDCPPSMTCGLNASARCGSGATCTGSAKSYVIHIGSGNFFGSVVAPSPGSVTYSGMAAENSAISWNDASGASATFDLSDTTNVVIQRVQVGCGGAAPCFRSTGGTVRSVLRDVEGITFGSGRVYDMTGRGNMVNGIINSLLYNSDAFGTPTANIVRHQQWPATCSRDPAIGCSTNEQCSAVGAGTCTGAGSFDFYVLNSFLQAGTHSSDGSVLLVEGKSCGRGFNEHVQNVVVQASGQDSPARIVGVEVEEADCHEASFGGGESRTLHRKTLLKVRGLRIAANVSPSGDIEGPDVSLEVGDQAFVQVEGELHHDSCTRKVTGTLLYADTSGRFSPRGGAYGGGSADLGVINCSAPATPQDGECWYSATNATRSCRMGGKTGEALKEPVGR
jgi:hypothetical protein